MEGKNTKSIKRSFATLTIFLLLISAIEMFISIQGSHTLSTNLKNVTDVQMPSLRLITLLDMLHDGLRSVVYSALLASASKNESELKSVQAELKEFTDNFNEHLSKLKQLDVTTNIKEAITKVEGPLNDYLASSKSIVDIALSDKTKEATDELPNFLASFKKLETELEVLVELIEKESETGKDQSLAFAQRNDTILKVTAFLGALVGILFFFFISRSTSKHLKNITGLLTQNSQDVNSLSESLGELSSHLSTSSQSQASSIQETASSLAEITSMMEKTKDSGNALKEASQQNLKLVEEGNENVKEMNESIEQIYQGNQGLFGEVEKSNAKFQEILELIKNIESKTKVINDIVFQTKLLSFNASVEAARAGEAGKGFAVVAEEVGNLASMSGKAAFEISGLINTSTQTVEKIVGDAKKFLQEIIVKSKSELDQGRSSTKKCQTSFEKIQDSTNEIGKNLEEMIFAINEQSTGVVEINKATQELDKNTQVLAQESHSLGQSIIQLNESAQSLESSIQTLHQLAGQSAQNDNQDNNFALSVDSNSESDTISSESKILSFLKLKSKTFRKKDSDHVA